ncbi:MAG: hypothetical protein JNL08_20385 [Planctomycetes bacterium]|nr:hypothetical protein [Planctomycetota bacterium]
MPKRTLEQLQRTVQESPSEYPWQAVVRTVLAEPVDDQKLVQQGLQAQRDWILRGGRERPAPPVGQRAKGLLARLVAQLIVCTIGTLLVIGALLLVKYRWPEWDIYRVLGWIQDLAQRLR